MKTNDIIKSAFDFLQDLNTACDFNTNGFQTLLGKKDIGDFELFVSGRVDNWYQGKEIYSHYVQMTYTIRIKNQPDGANLNGAFGGEIFPRTEIYQN
jgi:hypothetical protein